jgi:CHAD domain-containing protein
MLTKDRQKKYLNRKNQEWQQHLREFVATRDPESLHQLRVTLKKVKALARFTEACVGGNLIKDFNGLKKMFKQAGVIRDAGNHLELLERFHPAPQQYKEQQQQVQSTETEKFLRRAKKHIHKGKRAGRRLLGAIHSISAVRVHDWYAVQMVATGILLTASGDELHKARKQIKDMLYVDKLLPESVSESLRLDREYLDELQEAIGRWHDASIVVAAWAGKDLEASQAMVRDYRSKEAEVRGLASQFYLRAHRTTARPIASAAHPA